MRDLVPDDARRRMRRYGQNAELLRVVQSARRVVRHLPVRGFLQVFRLFLGSVCYARTGTALAGLSMAPNTRCALGERIVPTVEP